MRKIKSNPIHFGIEVTKPHSKEMYAHNNKVAKILKENILNAWNNLVKQTGPGDFCQFTAWTDIPDVNGFVDSDLVKLQKNVCYSGYGDGFTMGDVNDEFCSELETMPNWQIHEVYGYCCFDSLVPKVKQGMVGFDWEKMNYWTDTIESATDIIKRIGGTDVRWSSHADTNGTVTKSPYIKVYSKSEGEKVVNELSAHDIDAYVDCYEADDGDDYNGRPIILNFWSVQIKGYSEITKFNLASDKTL